MQWLDHREALITNTPPPFPLSLFLFLHNPLFYSLFLLSHYSLSSSYCAKELCSCILQAATKTFVKQSGLFLNFSLSHTHPLTHTRTHNTLTHSLRQIY